MYTMCLVSHAFLQMVRETEMTSGMQPGSSRRELPRPSTTPASNMPAWLADDDVMPSSRSSSSAWSRTPRSRSRRSQGVVNESAAPSSYHKLSLDLIKSMSGLLLITWPAFDGLLLTTRQAYPKSCSQPGTPCQACTLDSQLQPTCWQMPGPPCAKGHRWVPSFRWECCQTFHSFPSAA